MRVAFVSVILFLSGCSALLFETLWLRLSGLAFGNSVWSAALILSSFMAGLAVGSGIAARWKLPMARPLRVYASLEILVAIFGCTLVFALPLIGAWLRPLFQSLWSHQDWLNLLRFFLSFLILLIPATAMGLTLPVLVEDRVLRRYKYSRTIGVFYGCNTLGAVAGSLLGEAILIRMWGLFGTALTAAAICIIAASFALIISRQTAEPTVDTPVLFATKSTPWRLLIASAGTGLTLLTLEVVWFRFLRLSVSSSSIAFCVMLGIILAGIGLGGIFLSLIPARLRLDRQLLPVLLFLAAVATLLSYLFFPIPTTSWDKTSFDPLARFLVDDDVRTGNMVHPHESSLAELAWDEALIRAGGRHGHERFPRPAGGQRRTRRRPSDGVAATAVPRHAGGRGEHSGTTASGACLARHRFRRLRRRRWPARSARSA